MQSASTTAGTVPADGPLPGIPRWRRKMSTEAAAGAGEGPASDDRQDEEAQRCRGEDPPDAGGRHHVTRHDTTPRGMRYGTVGVNVTWPRERPRPVDVPLRAPAPPAQPRFWGRPRR